MKKSIIITILAMFTLVCLSAAFASEGKGPDGNKRKGKYTYRKVYKTCKTRGEVDSEKPKLSPADKNMAEWKAIFEGKTFDEFGCSQEWTGLSDTAIMDIYAYFYNHAKDSPSPAQCQ